jgi:hypothetical protein
MTNCTCAKDNPERAILSFIVGNVAASADAQLIPGARIVTAAMVVEQLAQGASTMAF